MLITVNATSGDGFAGKLQKKFHS